MIDDDDRFSSSVEFFESIVFDRSDLCSSRRRYSSSVDHLEKEISSSTLDEQKQEEIPFISIERRIEVREDVRPSEPSISSLLLVLMPSQWKSSLNR